MKMNETKNVNVRFARSKVTFDDDRVNVKKSQQNARAKFLYTYTVQWRNQNLFKGRGGGPSKSYSHQKKN